VASKFRLTLQIAFGNVRPHIEPEPRKCLKCYHRWVDVSPERSATEVAPPSGFPSRQSGYAAALKPLPRFLLCGYARTLAGKAVILGSDLNGRTVECPLTRDEVAARVKWVAHAHALAQERAARALNAAHRRQAGGGLEFEPPEQT
jgi:hypothetical protein